MSDLSLHYGLHNSAFGPVLIGIRGHTVTFLGFEPNPSHLLLSSELTQPFFDQIFIHHQRPELAYCGTRFQMAVWEQLLLIPFGETRTYSDIAIAIGNPNAVRAVGTAVGSNPISYLIPCHRILRKSGEIGGYRWGESIKKQLLSFEGIRYNRKQLESNP
jgi:AraC family transcriptional regulator of adaptative response/methylated-DNA-[protein]-cysteine methyltransferase